MSSIDVIVPCYRYGHFLRECVESVLSQDGPTVRVLIIDDASPDNTVEIATELAREDARVTFCRHASNRGHIATYNEGIEWVSATYMLLLSADDYLLPGALNRAANLMDGNANVGFVFGNVIEIADSGARTYIDPLAGTAAKRGWIILAGQEFIELSGARNIVPTPTAIVRTALQKRAGGYRPELTHTGDMEMWLRLAARTAVGFLQAHQAIYRRHSESMSTSYAVRNWLPDVQQRKLALDVFFRDGGSTLANAHDLRRKMYRSLACETVGFASSAFNDHDAETVRQLMEIAVATSPDVKTSWPWTKLACKRLMGMSAWTALRSAFVDSARRRG